jgi:hypothetical protein
MEWPTSGRFGDAEIRAWSLATDSGYTFDGMAGQPRVALLLAVSSGDTDPDDNRLGTLNLFYPRGNYFGDEATLGPRNFFNIHPALVLRRLAPRVQLNAAGKVSTNACNARCTVQRSPFRDTACRQRELPQLDRVSWKLAVFGVDQPANKDGSKVVRTRHALPSHRQLD